MKLLYNIPKADNHWFTTYHIYYKNKLEMRESIYNSYHFYNFGPFGIIEILIDDILILVDNDLASIEEDVIKLVKILIKDRKYLTFAHLLKFNSTQIKFNFNRIIFPKKSYIRKILLIIDHVADSTSSKEITRKKLLLKEQHLIQRAISAYITSVC